MAKKDSPKKQAGAKNPDEIIINEELTPDEAPSRKLSLIPFVVVIILIAVSILFYELNQYERATKAVIGGKAPSISLVNTQNFDVELSDYAGKVVIVNFWATWCKPCEEEIPSLVAMYSGFKKDDLVILAISIDKEKGPAEINNFAIAHNMDFQVLLDPRSSVGKRYGITGVPESFIIAKDGTIVKKFTGALDWTDPAVLALIQAELKKPAK